MKRRRAAAKSVCRQIDGRWRWREPPPMPPPPPRQMDGWMDGSWRGVGYKVTAVSELRSHKVSARTLGLDDDAE